MEAAMELRAKEYFDERATQEMKENLKPQERTIQEKLAYACRILAMTGQEAGLAGSWGGGRDRGHQILTRCSSGWDVSHSC